MNIPRFSSLMRYERHLSALAMVAGFAFDNFSFGRVDHPVTQIVLVCYLSLAAGSIAALHYFESRAEQRGAVFKWRPYLSAATQFALGGLWSAFLVFYARSSSLYASWPFLLLLAAMLIGNEVFRKYHSRLVFTSVLFFFALFSYTIFAVPIFTGTIGKLTFLVSGAAAVLIFALFLLLLDALAATRFREGWWKVTLGAIAVYAALNAFYFTNLLPPLPLALSQADVYHAARKTGDFYILQREPQPWYVKEGFASVVHVAPGEKLYLYSAVFAPIQLNTEIIHRWQRFDETRKSWVTESVVTFHIRGGREGGYRVYSIKSKPRPGRWRVDIDTVDGRLIGRIRFAVESVAHPVPTVIETVK